MTAANHSGPPGTLRRKVNLHAQYATPSQPRRPYQSIDYGNGSQLLVGACLPHGQKVAGKIPVDILLQKRNFPSDSGVNVKLVVQLDW